jgi:hypothetical protein
MKRTIAFLAVLIAASSFARAQYGHNSQIDPGPGGTGTEANDYAGSSVTPDANGNPRAPQACAPTATVNSFEMLQNKYGITGLVDPADPFAAVNELATDMGTQGDAFYRPPTIANPNPDYHTDHSGGTTAQDLVNGKVTYIDDHQTGGPAIQVHGQGIFGTFNADGSVNSAATGASTVPTDEFLQQQIAAGQDVEVWEAWVDPSAPGGHDGAHIITITGIDSANGKIDFVDPWGGVDVNASFILQGTGVGGVNGTYMRIMYPSANDGGDTNSLSPDGFNPDDPDSAMTADIAMVVAESPVPEPVAISLFIFGSGAMLLRRRTRTVA